MNDIDHKIPALYKYLSPARIDVLENLTIRYTQSRALNDPFEAFPAILHKDKSWYRYRHKQIIKDDAKNIIFDSTADKKYYLHQRSKEFDNFYECYTDKEWMYQRCQNFINLDSSVQGHLSLSANPDNILMWSHYAQSHEGFVIEFDGDHDYFSYGTFPIDYEDERPFLDVTRFGQDASVLYTKSKDWKYEAEYRKTMVFVEKISYEDGTSFVPFPEQEPANDDPILTEVKLFDYPKEIIKSIIIGWKSTDELYNEIIAALDKHELRETVTIYRSVPDARSYKMTIQND